MNRGHAKGHAAGQTNGAYGQCFSYAYREIMKRPNGLLVHANVIAPMGKTSYPHGWIERNGKVYDWQTMVMGASNFAGKGWPKHLFYQAFQPTELQTYTKDQALEAAASALHYGPWAVATDAQAILAR